MKRITLIATGLALLCLTACSGSPAASEPAPTAVEPAPPTPPPPTATAVPPTATPTNEPTAAPTATAAIEATMASPGFSYLEPVVVSRNPTPNIQNKYINPGAVLFHEGQFHMFFNSFSNWPGLVQIGYLTSTDGLTWQPGQAEPVFTSADVPFAQPGADVSSVVVADDGTWVAYFHTINSKATETGVIGRATAPSPSGPWTVDPEPVLQPGGEGEWDRHGLAWPSVVKTADGYFMYYGNVDRLGGTRIGMATSPDGITWTKYDDPTTAEAPFAASDPVLIPSQAWDLDSIDRPRVQVTPDGWVMIYQGGPLVKRGLAVSQDGTNWEPAAENPVLTNADFPLSGTMWDTALLYHEGQFYYYTEIGSMAGTDIYLAQATQLLP